MRDGEAKLVVGSRGSGKTAWALQSVPTGANTRLLVWDTVGEWSRLGRCQPVATLAELGRLVIADAKRPGRFKVGYTGPIVMYVPKGKSVVTVPLFPLFCRLAWVWMRVKPGTLVVEELADVTNPGKAPADWGEIVRKGRHTGSNIIALTQRPTESDTTIAGNADLIHCGRLTRPGDRRLMAEYLDCPVEQVTALQSLHWIERDMRTCRLTTGVLRF
jgi:hypothetical protein